MNAIKIKAAVNVSSKIAREQLLEQHKVATELKQVAKGFADKVADKVEEDLLKSKFYLNDELIPFNVAVKVTLIPLISHEVVEHKTAKTTPTLSFNSTMHKLLAAASQQSISVWLKSSSEYRRARAFGLVDDQGVITVTGKRQLETVQGPNTRTDDDIFEIAYTITHPFTSKVFATWLIQQGYLSEVGSTEPSITTQGAEWMRQNVAKALKSWKIYEYCSSVPEKFMKFLSLEDLPQYLSSGELWERELAKKRCNELKGALK